MSYRMVFMNGDPDKEFDRLIDALDAAERFVGNRSFARPFPNEDTYLAGPGDGSTSLMIRKDIILRSA